MIATATRVFAPDLRHLTRCLLRAAVRAGAAALVEDHHRAAARDGILAPAAREEEAQP
ncbi:hypothetical protein AB0O07_07325 [Streptomyces sp. NPDC093085]|uniref:hypothetical protein n=1 Tax=Streptomyces sp. NPDC093085 TaxID=3155068 RepID=UPI00342F982F